MGRIKHSAALFTSFGSLTERRKEDTIDEIEFIDLPDPTLVSIREMTIERLKAAGLVNHNYVTDIVQGSHNNYWSFAILPDGSKEGWNASDIIDIIRNDMVALARKNGIDAVFVSFGGDDDFTEIR